MANDNKAVGPLAAAKLVTLIKAETGKKYDKTGGKIDGSVKITGDLQVAGYTECGALEAQTYVKGDAMVMSPVIMLDDAATDVYLSTAGDGAAKMTITGADADAPLARLKVATPTGDNDAATKAYVDSKSAVATASANGLMSAADKAKLDGVEAGANKTTVDAALDATSTNPVQNKAVKTALDSKLSTRGGEVSGALSLTRGITVGRTSTYTGVHLYKDSEGVAKLTSGSADVDDTVSLARLKVASPTEDDDAATKAYVDNNAAGAGAVRYDAAQTLTDPQKFQARKNIGALSSELPVTTGPVSMCPANVTDSYDAVHVTTTKHSGDDFTLTIDCGPENALVRVKGIRTPTDAETNAAANVEYVKAKISEVSASGGVDVDNALSATSTNPVQNKVVKTALDAKMDKSGGTFTGNIYGKYFCGTWLQSTDASDLGRTPGRIAVLDDSGWVYYRTPSEILNDIGGASKEYVDDHAAGGATKVTISGTIEGEVSGYTSATYQQIVNEISKNCNIWLTIDGETIRLASWKHSGSAAYKLVFFGAGSGALTVKYEVTASASSATLTVTGG